MQRVVPKRIAAVIPIQDLYGITPAAAEGIELAIQRVQFQLVADHG
jgi:hypothetical protein